MTTADPQLRRSGRAPRHQPDSRNRLGEHLGTERLKDRHLWLFLFLILPIILGIGALTFYACGYFRLNDTGTEVGILGVEIAIITLYLSLLMFINHRGMIKQANRQLARLQDIQHTVRSSALLRENAEKIFFLGDRDALKYKCIFPVDFVDRPLPMILAGDYFALHVIQTVIGATRIELHDLIRDPNIPDPKHNDAELFTGNCIYVCTPWANRALRDVAPLAKFRINECQYDPINDLVWHSKLPIWFGENVTDKNELEKVICFLRDSKVNRPRILHRSPSDPLYQRMRHFQAGHRPDIKGQMNDYAILARVTASDFYRANVTEERKRHMKESNGRKRKIVIISGIHQYGTWIAGDFLREVTEGGNGQIYASKILEADDFVCVVGGVFDQDHLEVLDSYVVDHGFWQYLGGEWCQIILP